MSLLNNVSLIFGILVIVFALASIGQVIELIMWLNDPSVHYKKKIRLRYLETISQGAVLSLGQLVLGGMIVYYSLTNSFGWAFTLIGTFIAIRLLKGAHSEVTSRYERLKRHHFSRSMPPQENIPEEP